MTLRRFNVMWLANRLLASAIQRRIQPLTDQFHISLTLLLLSQNIRGGSRLPVSEYH